MAKGYGFVAADGGALPGGAWVHVSNINITGASDPSDTRLYAEQRCSFQVQVKPSPGNPECKRISAVNVIPGDRPSGELYNSYWRTL